MEFQTFLLFAMTTLIVVFSPGPAAITIASQGAANGPRKALFGVAGVAAANAAYFALSATGISALIIASHSVFSVIKWVGVLYLAYLGASALLSKSGGLRVNATSAASRSAFAVFAKGFAVEFAFESKGSGCFISQRSCRNLWTIPTARSIAMQIITMGATTLLIDLPASLSAKRLSTLISAARWSPAVRNNSVKMSIHAFGRTFRGLILYWFYGARICIASDFH